MSLRAVSSQSGLAIHGGPPVRTHPFAPWPQFSAEEIEAAAAVLRSGKVNYWTGENGPQFEQEFAAQIGCRRAVAVANGTLALELALYALGIGPGDEVIVPSRTFVATASCILMRGGTPVFADVERDSGTLTAESVRPLITGRTRAIIPVHLAGWPCDMDPLLALAREHQLRVIEDCAQAHGAFYKGRPVGALGDAASFPRAVKAACLSRATKPFGNAPGASKTTAKTGRRRVAGAISRVIAGCTIVLAPTGA